MGGSNMVAIALFPFSISLKGRRERGLRVT